MDSAQRMESNLARTFAQVLGIVMTAIGILGFIPALTPDGNLFGIFAVDTVHNLIHLITGLVGLAAGYYPDVQASRRYSLWYALAVGVVYAVVFIIGLIQGNTVLGLFVVNGADHILHLVIAAAGLGVYFAVTSRSRRPAVGGA